LISDNAMLATPTTAALSVRRTLTSLPSRDFTVSNVPSTASIVPRTPTVGGCCAETFVPSTDTNTSKPKNAGKLKNAGGIKPDIWDIVFHLPNFVQSQPPLSHSTPRH